MQIELETAAYFQSLQVKSEDSFKECRIENGDTKPRVRALEVERALKRVVVQQDLVLSIVFACTFANIGTVLSVSALPMASTACFVAAGFCALLTLVKVFQIRKMARLELQLSGAA
jgi:hypothetical protein